MLRFCRPELVSLEQAARIHALAVRILQAIGMEVRHAGALGALHAAGHRVKEGRVFFEPAVVEEHVAEMRRWIGSQPIPLSAQDDGRLSLSVSSYSLFVHDIASDQVVPYTTDWLIEMCKLMDSLAEEGVYGTPPGIPTDEHPDLQPVAQYRIAALYARQGATPVDPTSARTVHHLLDMAEVMGEPIRSLPVYVPSPLRLGGESLDVVLACQHRLSHISISSMPSTGATAPIQPFGALALAAAEVIGGMIAVRLLCDLPVTFGVGIFPFDLRAGAMVFGSPENLLYQMLCADFNRFYGWRRDRGPGNTHVMSKLPDAQAAADKAAIMAAGALLGARHFGSAGTLSLDEIFSPEQLLLDCEIRDWVQRAVMGMSLGEQTVEDPLGDGSGWLREIQAGLHRGFMGLDSTLDNYLSSRHGISADTTWYPRRFERGAIGAWTTAGQPRLSDRLRDEVRRRIAAHDFELDRDRRAEIERIYQAARRAVS
jgi:trimethylamine--corrinoid protein Co-methyltransferase